MGVSPAPLKSQWKPPRKSETLSVTCECQVLSRPCCGARAGANPAPFPVTLWAWRAGLAQVGVSGPGDEVLWLLHPSCSCRETEAHAAPWGLASPLTPNLSKFFLSAFQKTGFPVLFLMILKTPFRKRKATKVGFSTGVWGLPSKQNHSLRVGRFQGLTGQDSSSSRRGRRVQMGKHGI